MFCFITTRKKQIKKYLTVQAGFDYFFINKSTCRISTFRCGQVEYTELAFFSSLSILFSYASFYIFETIYIIKVRYNFVFWCFFGYCLFQLEFMYSNFFEVLQF